jgi:hypothetical protein
MSVLLRAIAELPSKKAMKFDGPSGSTHYLPHRNQ